MKKLLAAAFLFSACALHAAPNPTAFSGTVGHGNSGTITGSGFGTKTQGGGKPWLVFDFEDGTYNSNSKGWGPTTTLGITNQGISTDSRGVSTRTSKATSNDWEISGNGGNTALDLLMPDVGRSGKAYKFQKRKSSISVYAHSGHFENWKMDRYWINTNGSGWPNGYNAQNSDSATSCTGGGSHVAPTVEAGSGTNDIHFQSSYRLPGLQWMSEERMIKFSSANGVADGLYKIRQDGVLTSNQATVKTDPSASFPATSWRRWYTQEDPSNLTDCSGSNTRHDVWFDDIVVDYGPDAWARVLISTTSTFAASTVFEYQYTTAWNSAGNSITFTQNFGELSAAAKYVYVCDNADSCNSSGFQITSGGNPAPTVTAVVPSTGLAPGGLTVTVTGTGFITGAEVLIGTAPATGENVTSGTSMTAVVPGMSSTGTVSVTVTNTDTQSGIRLNSFSYVPVVTSISSVSPSSGYTTGGTQVTVTGTNLLDVSDITFGGVSATNETSISDTQMTCIVPAFNSAEAVNVTATNNNGASTTLSNGFTFTAPPVNTATKLCPCPAYQ